MTFAEARRQGCIAYVTFINALGDISPPVWVTAEKLVALANNGDLLTVNEFFYSYGVREAL